MAKSHIYIAEYRMPVGLDNPPLNLPHANTPKEVELTESQAAQAKEMLPDLKLVKKNKEDESEEEIESTESVESGSEEPSGSEGGSGGEEDEEGSDEESQEDESEEEGTSESDEGSEEDSSKEEEDQEITEHKLTEDFPGDEYLEKEGLTTVEDVIAYKKDSDLTEIDGIGPTRSDNIDEYIKENYPELLDEG